MNVAPIPSSPADLELIAQLQSKLEYAEVRIRVPDERLRLMRIEKYGTSGEKLSRAQMQLFELEPILWAQPNMPRQERFKMAGHQRKRIISTKNKLGYSKTPHQ